MAKRDFLAVTDLPRDEILRLFDLSGCMKAGSYRDTPLAGKTLAMIFAKSSTRTRVSFEVGTYQLGGQALFLSSRDIQIGRGEPIPDKARVLSRYVDGIMIRTFDHAEVEQLASHATVPVINGLTDLSHPCQVLADLFTVREALGGWEGKRIGGSGTATTWRTVGSRPPRCSGSSCGWRARRGTSRTAAFSTTPRSPGRASRSPRCPRRRSKACRW